MSEINTYDQLRALRDAKLRLTIVCATTGTGKSQIFINEVNRPSISGVMSQAGFYDWVYRHRKDDIVIDDAECLYQHRKWLVDMIREMAEERYLTWTASSYYPRDGVPGEFPFTGTITVLFTLGGSKVPKPIQEMLDGLSAIDWTGTHKLTAPPAFFAGDEKVSS